MSNMSKPQKCNGLDDVPTIQIYYVNDNSTKFAQIKLAVFNIWLIAN